MGQIKLVSQEETMQLIQKERKRLLLAVRDCYTDLHQTRHINSSLAVLLQVSLLNSHNEAEHAFWQLAICSCCQRVTCLLPCTLNSTLTSSSPEQIKIRKHFNKGSIVV